jgi:hypothetical protein
MRYFVEIKDGTADLTQIESALLSKEGWACVEIKRLKSDPDSLPEEKIRSLEQNNYYWGVVIPAIKEYIGEWDADEVHEALKQEFLQKKIKLQWDKRRVLKLVKSTTQQTTIEMASYLTRIRDKFAVTIDGQRYSIVPAPKQEATIVKQGSPAYLIDPLDLKKAYN